MTEPRSYLHVRMAIFSVDPRLAVKKNIGFLSYCWFSKDKELAKKIQSNKICKIVNVPHWSELTLEQWKLAAREYLAAIEGGEKMNTKTPTIEKTAEGFRVTFQRGNVTETRTFGLLGGAEAVRFFNRQIARPNS